MNQLADGLRDLSLDETNAGEDGGATLPDASAAEQIEHDGAEQRVSKHADSSLYVATRVIPNSWCKRAG